MHKDMQRSQNRRFLAAAALAATAALTAMVYWPAIHAGWFIMDDYVFFFGNSDLLDTAGLRSIWFDPWNQPHYYPVLLTFIWVIAALFGVEPMPYHIAGIILHFLNAILVWQILAALRVRHAALIGLVFLFHPLCVSSVAWNTELKNTLSGLWALGAMLVWTTMFATGGAGRSFPARPAWWLTLGLLVLAIFSKSSSATILLLMAAAAFWFPPENRRSALLSLAPLFAISLAFGVFSLSVEHSFNHPEKVREIPIAESLMIAGQSVYFYASKVIWPSGLNFIYPAWQFGRWSGWLWPLSLPLVGTLFWMLRRFITPAPAVLFSLFVVLVFPIPFMSIGFLHAHGFVTDHFVYLAMLPVIVGTVIVLDGLARLSGSPENAATCMLLAAFGALAVLTSRQVELFVGGGIWERSVARMNQVTSAHLFYAQELEKQNRLEEARMIAENVLARKPDSVGALNVLASLELRSGNDETAVALLERAVELSPRSRGFDIFKTKAASAFLESGHEDTAEKYYRQALLENPRQIAAMQGLASLLAKKGQHEEAAEVLEDYVALMPQDEAGWTRLIESHALRGNWASAKKAVEHARTALPRNEALRLRQAMLLAETGSYAEAGQVLDGIAVEKLGATDVLRVAIVHQRLGQDRQAQTLADLALRQGGDNPSVLNAAAWFFATNRDAEVRDPARAWELSEKARRMAGSPSHSMMGTAAAALAANGKFAEAVAMAATAIETASKAGDQEFVQATMERKKLYAEKRAYIDHPETPLGP
jgi:tetratricopeptide (TPR) repeat protein